MSDENDEYKVPTFVKLAMTLVCLAVVALAGGLGLAVWAVAAVAAVLVYLHETWPYVLLVLATTSSFGAWTAQGDWRSRLRRALRYASYTILAGGALYLAIAIYVLSGINHL